MCEQTRVTASSAALTRWGRWPRALTAGLPLRATDVRPGSGLRQRRGDPRDCHQAAIDGSGSASGSLVGADGSSLRNCVAELANSSKLVPLVHPADAAPEPGYVPSKALADFVRCRDLTCAGPAATAPRTTAISTTPSPTPRRAHPRLKLQVLLPNSPSDGLP